MLTETFFLLLAFVYFKLYEYFCPVFPKIITINYYSI